MQPQDLILQPVIQYGFLGFSVVLLGINIWLIRSLLHVLSDTQRVIEANTRIIQKLESATTDMQNDIAKEHDQLFLLLRSLHDRLLSRPCINRGES